MDRHGFLRVSAGFPLVKIADIEYNVHQSLQLVHQALSAGSKVLVLPELGITGYTCGDLFHQQILLKSAIEGVRQIANSTTDNNLLIFVGAPLIHNGSLYNCAVGCAKGKVIGVVPKIHLPNYNEFYEKRWFSSGKGLDSVITIGEEEVPISSNLIFKHLGVKISAELCEDLWVPFPPSVNHALAGADVIVNLSATDELIGKHDYLLGLISGQSARLRCGYIYSSAGAGESSTDAVYAGNAIIAEDGRILSSSPRFSETSQLVTADLDIEALRHDRLHFETYYEAKPVSYREVLSVQDESPVTTPLLRTINTQPFVPTDGHHLDERCREVTSIQTAALVQRLRATGCKALTVGISGGLDSTLALLIAVRAFDKLDLPRKNIHAITMPGFGTTKRTHNNAETIMKELGVTLVEIPINYAVLQHFKDIHHNPEQIDVTYENSQARERTQILMDYANRVGGMVLGTGDLSELALGWCTYNADHMSMYGVNSSVPKTLVRHLVAWLADTEVNEQLRKALYDIIDTPVSPELKPADSEGNIAQKTEDLVGPYELHDFFLYNTMRYGFSPAKVYRLAKEGFEGKYDENTIKHWLKTFYRRFFSQQFKRSCLPDGPKTGSVSISPRADWRMPSDASSALWLKETENI